MKVLGAEKIQNLRRISRSGWQGSLLITQLGMESLKMVLALFRILITVDDMCVC